MFYVIHLTRVTGREEMLERLGTQGPLVEKADPEVAALEAATSHDLPEDKSQCFKEEQGLWWGRDKGQETITHYYYVE
jgi:hypothetical protein